MVNVEMKAKVDRECKSPDTEFKYFQEYGIRQVIRRSQSQENGYNTLVQKEQGIIFHLRTGHSRLSKDSCVSQATIFMRIDRTDTGSSSGGLSRVS